MRINNINKNDPINSITGFTMSVWFQGCDNFCNGCYNKSTWDFEAGEYYSLDDLKKIINESKHDNITLIGGDPFFKKNREEVIELIKWIKLKTNKVLYVWSGFLKEEIEKFVDVSIIDYLIDGKFEKDKLDLKLILRSTTNQRIFKNGEILNITIDN